MWNSEGWNFNVIHNVLTGCVRFVCTLVWYIIRFINGRNMLEKSLPGQSASKSWFEYDADGNRYANKIPNKF